MRALNLQTKEVNEKLKARDVLALILLWIGVGAVAWGDEISKVVGVVLITLLSIASFCAPKP